MFPSNSNPTLLAFLLVVSFGCIKGDKDSPKSEGNFQDRIYEKLGRYWKEESQDSIRNLLSDNLSDLDLHLSTVQLIERAGFKAVTYDSRSEDGYVTQVIRIVNPLAKPEARKKPPIALYGGQTISPAAFLFGSGNGHNPMHWPPADWSTPSRKRSLAFLLSNSGYDVWLVGARGVDAANRRRVGASDATSIEAEDGGGSLSRFASKLIQTGNSGNRSLADCFASFTRQLTAKDYWSFSNDEIIAHELRTQLRLIIDVSGEQKVSLITYANGGLISFGMLANDHEFAEQHIDTLVSLAPAVYVNKLNLSFRLKVLVEPIARLPLVDQFDFGGLAKRTALGLCGAKQIRYTICKIILDSLYGSSDLFQTALGLAIIKQFIVPTSAKSLQQVMQIADSNEFRKFNHGLIENQLIYGEFFPPAYKLSNISLPKMFVIGGENDAIVDRAAIDRLEAGLGAKFKGRTEVRGYNHIDLLAAWNVDEEVNEPILNILEDEYYGRNYEHPDSEGEGKVKQVVEVKSEKSALVNEKVTITSKVEGVPSA